MTSLLLDHACGDCVACGAGCPVWCERPTTGQPLCSVPKAFDVGTALRVFRAFSAFLAAGVSHEATVLAVATNDGAAIIDFLTLAHAGTVLMAGEPWDPRVKTQLAAASDFGRADVVVSLLSGRDAVLAVRRGGTVCLGESDMDMPSVTELAQREVRIVGPHDLAAVVKRFGRETVEQVLSERTVTVPSN